MIIALATPSIGKTLGNVSIYRKFRLGNQIELKRKVKYVVKGFLISFAQYKRITTQS